MVGPENSRKTEKVAPVSRRKETGRPFTMITTLGSRFVMETVGKDPRPRQSSSASPMTGGERGLGLNDPSLLRVRGQSEPQ